MQEKEIWKDIENYEGVYSVSNHGRVKRISSGRILKNSINSTGYNQVALSVRSKVKHYCVHRLVALAFITNSGNGFFTDVNHKDEIKTNNFYLNLEWVTKRQNKNYSVNKRSSSAHPGVSWHKRGRKWVSKITFKNKSIYLGVYSLEEDAAKAYVDFCFNNNLM